MMRARCLTVISIVLCVSACAPVLVKSFRHPGADLSRYRTYAWAADAPHSTGDARLDSNPFVDGAARRAINRALASRGLEESAAAPQLTLRYFISITQKLDLAGVDSTYLTCEECSPSVYDAGTMVIDVFDTDTRALLWRGWAEGTFDRVIDNQRALEQRIDEVVAKIMARYPPG
jgi:hypothetical protein